MQSNYDGIQHVVHISTNIGEICNECTKRIGLDTIAESINHYIEHGYKLLHVGTETSHDKNGNPWHSTVAILGK
jgi:hypothetical protein